VRAAMKKIPKIKKYIIFVMLGYSLVFLNRSCKTAPEEQSPESSLEASATNPTKSRDDFLAKCKAQLASTAGPEMQKMMQDFLHTNDCESAYEVLHLVPEKN
jgi:hypothetical protein